MDLIGVAFAVFLLNTAVYFLFDFDIVCFITTFLKTRVFGSSVKSKDKTNGNS
jgi:hypothetical protein